MVSLREIFCHQSPDSFLLLQILGINVFCVVEEDLVGLRRRVSDIEDENESLNVQLAKMSAAKSPRHFKVHREMCTQPDSFARMRERMSHLAERTYQTKLAKFSLQKKQRNQYSFTKLQIPLIRNRDSSWPQGFNSDHCFSTLALQQSCFMSREKYEGCTRTVKFWLRGRTNSKLKRTAFASISSLQLRAPSRPFHPNAKSACFAAKFDASMLMPYGHIFCTLLAAAAVTAAAAIAAAMLLH